MRKKRPPSSRRKLPRMYSTKRRYCSWEILVLLAPSGTYDSSHISTCLHVEMWDESYVPDGASKTRISQEQYRRLVEYILGSFRRDEGGRFLRIEQGAYGADDAFYHAQGSYHAFNTCNCWVGGGLKSAGVRTGWFTPLPKTVSLYMAPTR